MMLAINHDAKGITYWIYPSTNETNDGSATLGKALQVSPAIDFLFGTETIKGLDVTGETLIDASAWVLGSQILVGIINGQYGDSGDSVTIDLPQSVTSISRSVYGDSTGWAVDGSKLTKSRLKGLEVDILLLNVGLG